MNINQALQFIADIKAALAQFGCDELKKISDAAHNLDESACDIARQKGCDWMDAPMPIKHTEPFRGYD